MVLVQRLWFCEFILAYQYNITDLTEELNITIFVENVISILTKKKSVLEKKMWLFSSLVKKYILCYS